MEEAAARVPQAGCKVLSEKPSLDCCAAGVVFATPQGHTFEVHTPIPDRIYDRRHFGAGVNPLRMDHVNITSPEPAETQRHVEQIMGLRLSEKLADDGLIWMRGANRQHHIMGIVRGATGLHHYSFELEDFGEYCRLGDLLDQYDKQLAWGPGRHRPGDNLYAYYVDAAGVMVECSAGMALIADDDNYQPNIITRSSGRRMSARINVWGIPAPQPWLRASFPLRAGFRSVIAQRRHIDIDGVNMQEKLSFTSDGLKLSGVLHVPEGRRPGSGCRASSCCTASSAPRTIACRIAGPHAGGIRLCAFRIDLRGCGESEGERGQVRCFDQVADTKNALTFIAAREEIDPARIGVIGHSFGAAVAVYTAGLDERFACVISSCGWGDGERKFRGQHPTPEAWAKFTGILEQGRKHKAETGESMWVSRFDVVPIPESLRKNLSPKALMEVPVETAISMYNFRAEDVVANIAPRPLLLFHTANDVVTPTEQSIRLLREGRPACGTDARQRHLAFPPVAKRMRRAPAC